ncbi:MAG: glycine zipper family protein [Burkholderiaceae bacterium]|nr:glycine zipper family protein [Burkholderiaceae bacterium]
MQSAKKYPPLLAALLLLGACTTVPTGPTVAVMPGTGKSLEQFNADDLVCRQYASNSISGAVQASNDKAVESGVVGSLIGAAAGAALGGNHQGAAVGAGAGLLVGSAGGANSSQYGSYNIQRRYDVAYEQCMYTKGNSVPVAGGMRRESRPPVSYAPPPPNMPPPPDAPH